MLITIKLARRPDVGEAIKMKRPECGCGDEDHLPPPANRGEATVIMFQAWSLDLILRIFSSLLLTRWHWSGHNIVMDFDVEPKMTEFIKHPRADEYVWQKMQSIFFLHFCQNFPPENRKPITVSKFLKSEMVDKTTVRIWFETDWFAGKKLHGKLIEEEYYGTLREGHEDAILFECQFALLKS